MSEREEWRSIPGYPAYEASSQGRVRSLSRFITQRSRSGNEFRLFHKGRLLKLSASAPTGRSISYLVCALGKGNCMGAHRAVCLAFHGKPPTEHHEVAHLDGNTKNNRPGNLIWATKTENSAHKLIHGTLPLGERAPGARLKNADVREVFALSRGGTEVATLARKYGVQPRLIRKVLRRDTYACVNLGDGL